MVLGDKWEVAIAVVVELDGPVGAKVKGTFVENWKWEWWVVSGNESDCGIGWSSG
jgi:hypothetical protein